MPEMDGYQICERVKSGEFGADIPVVLLADVFEPLDVTRLSTCGADGHITKPFDARTLQLMIHDQLGIESPGVSTRASLPPVTYTVSEGRLSTNGASHDDSSGGQEAPAFGRISPADLDAVAEKVVKMLSSEVVREIAWEVLPEMSEVLIREQMQRSEMSTQKR